MLSLKFLREAQLSRTIVFMLSLVSLIIVSGLNTSADRRAGSRPAAETRPARTAGYLSLPSAGERPLARQISWRTRLLAPLASLSQRPGIIANIALSAHPSAIAVNANTNLIYIADAESRSVAVIDGTSQEVVTSIKVGGSPAAIGINSVTNRVYVVNNQNRTLSVIDGNLPGAMNSLIARIKLPGREYQARQVIAINSVQNLIHIVSAAPQAGLITVDGASNRVLSVTDLPANPSAIAVDEQTAQIFIGYEGDFRTRITIIDADTVSDGPAVGLNHSAIWADAGKGRVYLLAGDINKGEAATIAVIDARSHNLLANIPVAAGTSSIAVNTAAQRAYMADDRGETLTIIDLENGQNLETIQLNIGRRSELMAVNGVTNKIYLINLGSNRLTVIDDNRAGCRDIQFVSATLPESAIGSDYQQEIIIKGGAAPFTFSVTEGELPEHFKLDADSGTITGRAESAGQAEFTITVFDANGCTSSKKFSINAQAKENDKDKDCKPITFDPSTFPNGTVGTDYSLTIRNSGTGNSEYTVTSGALPDGLSIRSNGINGVISGRPTKAGSFTFEISVVDVKGCKGSQTFTITIDCAAITIAPTSLSAGKVGISYSQTLTASGGTAPYSFALTGGSLPNGLSLSSNGAISGTPTVAGNFSFTITATDSSSCKGSQSFTLQIDCPIITISPSSLAAATTGVAYEQSLTASGGTAPYTFVISGGALPNNFSLSSSGAITGTPSTAGSFNFTVTATDANGCKGSLSLSLLVACPTINISPGSLAAATTGVTYQQSLSASGGTAPYTFAISGGALPANLSLSSSGAISGTPTTAGSFSFTVTATDANGCKGSLSLTLQVACPTITITPGSLNGATVGVAFNQSLTANGGSAPYTFAVSGGALPANLSLSSSGAISGTPSAAGSVNFTVTATDANGCKGSQTFTIQIGCPTINITPSALADGIAGLPYQQSLSASGGTAPYTFAISGGALPADLSLSASGAISGTPSAAGNASFTVTVTDANGCQGSANFTMATNAAGTLQFSSGSFSVDESGVATVTVTRTEGSAGSVTVNYATGDITASGKDYRAASGSLQFGPGVTSQTFTIAAVDDTTDENDESVQITLSAAGGGAKLGSLTSATLTIIDNDAAPTVSINDVSVKEGTVGSATALFTVTLSAASEKTITVNFATAGNSATDKDFNSAAGTLTFMPGTTSQTITVTVNGDPLHESDETFFVNLSNPSNATMAKSQGRGTIMNDDAMPQLAFSASTFTITEGGTVTITINRNENAAGPVSVSLTTNNGSATNGSDFNDASGQLSFADGESVKTITINTMDDDEVEGDENVNLVLSSPSGATLGISSAVLTIKDNDIARPGQLGFSPAEYSFNENSGSVTISVARTGGSNVPVTVSYSLTSGSALAGNDVSDASGTLTFGVGVTSRTINLRILEDNELEGSESFNLVLTSTTGGATISVARAVVTIVDNDSPEPGTLQFGGSAISIGENQGFLSVTVSRNGGSNVPVAVNVVAIEETASLNRDFSFSSTTLNFAAGVTTQTFSISLNDDNEIEGDETFTLMLANATNGARLGQTSILVTIQDNDVPPNTPVLQVNRNLIDFGDLLIGQSDTRTLTIKNGGRAELTIKPPAFANESDGAFSIVNGPATLKLAPGQSMPLTLKFTPTIPNFATITGTIVIGSNGGTASVVVRGRCFDDITPSVRVLSPAGGETLVAGKPFIIQFEGDDNDTPNAYIVSASLDGETFPIEIARVSGKEQSVIWNVPDLFETKQGRIRVVILDRAGNQSLSISNSFSVQRATSGSTPLPTLRVMLKFDPPPANRIAPPQNVRIVASEAPPTATIIAANAETGAPELLGYNIYRMPINDTKLPTAEEIVNPANLVGSVNAGSTSFTDNVSTSQGNNFVYSITSFFGGGQQSGGSNPASTDLPVIKNPVFRNGTIFFEAAGSFIKQGAVLIINSDEVFPLQFDDSGALITVMKKMRSQPDDMTIKKVIKRERPVTLVVKNPDGKTSVSVTFMRQD